MTSDPLGITETERPVRGEQRVHLQREVWHSLHRQAAELRAVQADAAHAAAADRERFEALVTDLARAHHQFTVFLGRHAAALQQAGCAEQAALLETIHHRYGQVLTRAGAELTYPDGQPFTLDMVDTVTITAAVPSEDVRQPIVRETVNPGVRLGAELICKAEVQLAIPRKSSTADESADPTGGPQ